MSAVTAKMSLNGTSSSSERGEGIGAVAVAIAGAPRAAASVGKAGRDACTRGTDPGTGREDAAGIDRTTGGGAVLRAGGAAAPRTPDVGGGQIAPVCPIARTGMTGGAGGTGRGEAEVEAEASEGGEDGRAGRPDNAAPLALGTARTETGAGVTSVLCTVMRSR